MFLGLRTIIYPSKDVERDKAFWTKVLDVRPYFDKPFYVGFDVGGYELGLDPNGEAEGMKGPVTYWGVKDIAEAVKDLQTKGLRLETDIQEVGMGIKTACFYDASGALFGLIENPGFRAHEE